MRRRRWLWIVLPLLLVAAALAWGLTLHRDVPVSRARFESVHPGMSLEPVSARLGGPAGDYRTGEVDLDLSGGSPEFDNVMTAPEVLLGEVTYRHEWWQGDEGTAWVCFDEQGRVVTREFTPGSRVNRPWWQRLLALFGP